MKKACANCKYFEPKKWTWDWQGQRGIVGECQHERGIRNMPHSGTTTYFGYSPIPFTRSWTNPGYIGDGSFCSHFIRRPWYAEREYQEDIARHKAAFKKIYGKL